jgi:kynureninase
MEDGKSVESCEKQVVCLVCNICGSSLGAGGREEARAGQTKARDAWSEVVSSCMTLGTVRGERGGNNTFNVKLS